MATYVKFEPFVENLAEKVFNLGADTLTVALSATVPTVSWGTLSQVSQISYTNLSARAITTGSSAQTSGTYKLVMTDLVLTASGAVATFRYVVIYDDTATSDELICYFDHGSNVTLANAETYTLDFDGTNGLLQIA
jgi:hypothetical protein